MSEESDLVPLDGLEVLESTDGRQYVLKVLPQNGSRPVHILGNTLDASLVGTKLIQVSQQAAQRLPEKDIQEELERIRQAQSEAPIEAVDFELIQGEDGRPNGLLVHTGHACLVFTCPAALLRSLADRLHEALK